MTATAVSPISASCDVIIVGAGPAGLTLAAALSRAGLSSIVLEQQPRAQLQHPAPDGREIALTHPSVATLERLGAWARLAEHERGRIVRAIVHDGPVGANAPLEISGERSGEPFLGRIVPNAALRRAAWEVASQSAGVHIIDSARIHAVRTHADGVELSYSLAAPPNGTTSAQSAPSSARGLGENAAGDSAAAPQTFTLHAPLIVAADSRMSSLRRMLGVGARMVDFGRTVIVCRLRHAQPHGHAAHECFGWERTLAILPLNDEPDTGRHLCSAVVTTDSAEANRLMALPDAEFAQQVAAHFDHRLGAMELVGQRHAYPLVATYARRFAGHRWALLGDAAVGMHPVTAHGFNLGLAGVERLVAAISSARNAGHDIGLEDSLRPYARAHHRHAWPMFEGTNAIVHLFTQPGQMQKILRQGVLGAARRITPIQAAIVAQLTGKSALEIMTGHLPIIGPATQKIATQIREKMPNIPKPDFSKIPTPPAFLGQFFQNFGPFARK